MRFDERISRWAVGGLMLRALRETFHEVSYFERGPLPPPGRTAVLYANHHNTYDGYLAWLVLRKVLGRPGLLWMKEWDRFPLFGAVGARPFPADDARRRAATVRQSLRLLRERPGTVFVYFVGGEITDPEGGPQFDPEAAARLLRLLPDAYWWPLAIHITWRGKSAPTALLAGGRPDHDGISDVLSLEAPPAPAVLSTALDGLWRGLQTAQPEDGRRLLKGRPDLSERWNLNALAPFFRRYL